MTGDKERPESPEGDRPGAAPSAEDERRVPIDGCGGGLALERSEGLPAEPSEESLYEREWYVAPRRRVWRPPTDVYETDESIVVKVEVAGMHEDDFRVSFANRRLVIAGQRRDPVGKIIYQNMEIRYGEFRTEVRIGWALDQSGIEATYEAGFLYVRLPKRAAEHRININTPADT